jgi:acyl-CoA carboxylase subunit beta
VCVLTDPTYGGVSASFAALGSVVVAERGAHVGFAGPRVVEQTIRQPLPSGFQTAEFLLAHGLIDRVEHRAELRPLLARLIRLHGDVREHVVSGPVEARQAEQSGGLLDGGPDADPWLVVQQARDVDRPTTRDYVRMVFDDFVEIHGDRAFADDPALVAGIASMAGRPMVVLGQQKGRTVKNLVETNFGMAHPEGYRKALRMLDHAERFGMPVVTLVDTPGAHPGVEAEERGQFIAIADMVLRISRLRAPVVSVITGEGGSGGALALCGGDRLLMLEHSFLSVISPEGCAAILWRSAAEAPRAARALRLGPRTLRDLGIAHRIVPEPPGGAQAEPAEAARRIREAVIDELDVLCMRPVEALLNDRLRRFDLLDEQRVTT